MNTKELNRPH